MIRVEPVIPKKLDMASMYKVLESEMGKYGKYILKDFENVVQPWSEPKPSFELDTDMNPQYIEIRVKAKGSAEGLKKWIFVDQGTRPHTIRAKNAKTLAFPSAYSAGSRPGSARTFKSSSGGTTVFAPEVQHPGTEKRDFTGTIFKDHQKPLKSWMDAAMGHAAAASGHEI